MVALLTSKQSRLEIEIEPLETALPVGSLVYVTCYGQFYGFRGIIRSFDIIATSEAPLYFYLVAFEEGHVKEPLWVIRDDIAIVEGENVSQWRPREKELSQVEAEALSIVTNISQRARDKQRETPSSIAPREVVAV